MQQNAGRDDPRQRENTPQMRRRENQAFLFLIAEHEWIKASKKNTVRDIRHVGWRAVKRKIRSAVQCKRCDRQL